MQCYLFPGPSKLDSLDIGCLVPRPGRSSPESPQLMSRARTQLLAYLSYGLKVL